LSLFGLSRPWKKGVEYLNYDLKQRSVRGTTVNLLGQSSRIILNLGSTAVLARLLTPEDFGIMAMVMAIIGFVISFRSLGLSMSIVQRDYIERQQLNTLFWTNAGFGMLMFLTSCAIAAVLAHVYHEPRLFEITLVIAIGFVFGGLASQHQAILIRHMRFSALNAVETLSVLGGICVGIFSALRGWGYWSLVFRLLSEQFFLMTGMWLTSDWRPGKPSFSKEACPLLKFGGNLTAVNILFHLLGNVDKFLIGKFCGSKPLGLYSLASQMLNLPAWQINLPFSRVVIPGLSRLQKDPSSYRNYYLKSLQFLLDISLPMVVFLWVAAEHLVQVFLGERWLDSVLLFRLLGPAALCASFGVAARWVFISLGQTDRLLRWTLLTTPLTVLGFVVGLRWGAIGVAASYSITRILLLLPSMSYCYKKTFLKIRDLWNAFWRPAVSSAIAALFLLFVPCLKVSIGVLWSLGLEFLIFVSLYLVAWIGLPGGRAQAREAIDVMKELNIFKKDGKTASAHTRK